MYYILYIIYYILYIIDYILYIIYYTLYIIYIIYYIYIYVYRYLRKIKLFSMFISRDINLRGVARFEKSITKTRAAIGECFLAFRSYTNLFIF